MALKFKALWINRSATQQEIDAVRGGSYCFSWIKKRFLLFPVTCKLPRTEAVRADETRWLCMARWIDIRGAGGSKVPFWFDEADAPKLAPLLNLSPDWNAWFGIANKLQQEPDTEARLKAQAELDKIAPPEVQCARRGI